jgi:glycolate oxidase
MEASREAQHKALDRQSDVSNAVQEALAASPAYFPERATVACQGVEGAYQQIACDRMFKRAAITFVDSFGEVMAKVEQACELVLEAGAIDVLVADTSTKIKDAWAARSSFLEAIESETKLLDECDVVVPINKIAEFLTFAKQFGEECGLEIKSFGHAGDGNLHIYQCSNDLEEEEFKRRVDKYFNVLYKRATEIGGLVSGEHGIGRGKMKYLRECLGETSINLMFGIKKVFDPNLILNPGKVCYPIEGVD